MNRELLLKVAPFLRKIKSNLIGLRGRILILKRQLKQPSKKGSMVLLSLGEGKGSPYVASAVDSLGYDLVVVSNKFPMLESPYTKKWVQCNPFGDFEILKEKVKSLSPIAVLVEQRNILLPIKARLNIELNLVDYGDKSHKTSNSKVELRQAIDDAGVSNIPWCLLEDYTPDNFPFPFVIKPEIGTGSRGITIVENKNDLDEAIEKLKSLEDDETVGGRIFIEAVIIGRQFDVEGIYKDGEFTPLSLTEEQYDIIDKSLPSAWYLFSPPIEPELRSKLLESAKQFTKALGVKNGAIHCEMRVTDDEKIYVIDYSNRMGYPHLVSESCGYFFPKAYVEVMAGETPDFSNLQENTVFQRFIRSKKELASYKKLMEENPELVIQKNMLGSHVGGIATYARIALRSKSFDDMVALLSKYDVLPLQWEELYQLSTRKS